MASTASSAPIWPTMAPSTPMSVGLRIVSVGRFVGDQVAQVEPVAVGVGHAEDRALALHADGRRPHQAPPTASAASDSMNFAPNVSVLIAT